MEKTDKIIVTGGSGFLGNHVLNRLVDFGYSNIYLPQHYDYDLTDHKQCYRLLQMERPEAVIHLAASVGGIGANQKYPADYFYRNLMMGVNIIECSRIFSVRKIVLAGTVCSYPENCPVPFLEEDIWEGYPEPTNSGYGLSKRAVLSMAKQYVQQYEMDITPLVLVNMYGPGDNFSDDTSHVIPALIKRIQGCIDAGTNLDVWGTGEATREFLHVRDAANAFVHFLGCQSPPGECINIGTGIEISIRSLVVTLCDIMEFNNKFVFDSSKPNGQMRRCLDVSRASSYGFDTDEDFEEGLQEIVNDYRYSIQ